MRLLLLQNRSAFAERLATALAEGGLLHCECHSLSDCERHLTANSPPRYDAVVLDLRRDTQCDLPLCRRVMQCVSDTPVIVVTALDDHDEALQLVQAGIEEVCLRDEFDVETLRDRIRCAIERHRVTAQCHVRRAIPQPAMAGTTGDTPTLPGSDPRSEGTEPHRMRMACLVAPGMETHTVSEPLWTASLGLPVEIVYWDVPRDLIRYVALDEPHVVIMYLDQVDATALESIVTIKTYRPSALIILAAPDLEGELALQAIRHGAEDCVGTVNLSHGTVTRYLKQGLVRSHRRARQFAENDSTNQRYAHVLPPSLYGGLRDRRYYITKSAIAIPILPDRAPDQSLQTEGFTVDLSHSGIGFDIAAKVHPPSNMLLLGVEDKEGDFHFATVAVRHCSPDRGRWHVGAQFVTGEQDLLRPENLTPTFRAATHEFETDLPTETLLQWVEVGVLRPVLVDRIYVCPKCGGMPTFRSGCRSCGSIHVASQQLIHHFDCSYLGRIGEFESDGSVVCPKCGRKGRIGDEAFESLSGPCHCLECNWSDTNTEVVGQCLRCNWHFPLKNAHESELIGYQARRLDPHKLVEAL